MLMSEAEKESKRNALVLPAVLTCTQAEERVRTTSVPLSAHLLTSEETSVNHRWDEKERKAVLTSQAFPNSKAA
jgi:hypothetical protein